MKAEVGYRIRKLRESKDFSQENMAGELNISASAYSKIERGKTDPSIGRLAEIAKILDVDVTYFFSVVGKNIMQDKPELKEFATKYDIEEITKQISLIKQELILLKKEKTVKANIKRQKKN